MGFKNTAQKNRSMARGEMSRAERYRHSGGGGKGDARRPCDSVRFGKGYDQIDWSK